MHRRAFVKLALAAVAVPTGLLVTPEPGYGLIDARAPGYGYNFRCFLDDVEVTSRSHRANDREGWVDMYDEPKQVVGDEVASRRYYGRVRLAPKA